MDLNDFLTNSVLLLKKEEIGTIIGPDAEKYEELVELAFSRDMPVCWRATWILDYLAELHPWLAETYIERFWTEIPANHPLGVTRSLLRLLSRYEIPEAYQGPATDLCLDWLSLEAVPVAIKAYSMEILLKIARLYPELSKEFIAIIEDHSEYNSAGYKARARQVISELQKL